MLTEDKNTIANQNQTENIVKRILTSEVKYAIGIIFFIIGVVKPYYSIETDIALIKQNHISHMETMTKEIEQLESDQTKLRDTEVQLMQTIAERLPEKK